MFVLTETDVLKCSPPIDTIYSDGWLEVRASINGLKKFKKKFASLGNETHDLTFNTATSLPLHYTLIYVYIYYLICYLFYVNIL